MNLNVIVVVGMSGVIDVDELIRADCGAIESPGLSLNPLSGAWTITYRVAGTQTVKKYLGQDFNVFDRPALQKIIADTLQTIPGDPFREALIAADLSTYFQSN